MSCPVPRPANTARRTASASRRVPQSLHHSGATHFDGSHAEPTMFAQKSPCGLMDPGQRAHYQGNPASDLFRADADVSLIGAEPHQKRSNLANLQAVIRIILLYSFQRHAGILGLVRFLNNRYASSRFNIPQSRSPIAITAA